MYLHQCKCINCKHVEELVTYTTIWDILRHLSDVICIYTVKLWMDQSAWINDDQLNGSGAYLSLTWKHTLDE